MMHDQNDITIPVLEIEDGWAVDDIKTIEDCDDAHAVLTAAIISIEAQIDEAIETKRNRGDWYRRLNRALRWKKAAMQAVQNKRGAIARAAKRQANLSENRKLLEWLREHYPTEFQAAVRATQGASK